MSEDWTKCGRIETRAYSCGTTGIALPDGNRFGAWYAGVKSGGPEWHGDFDTLSEAKAALDKRFDPQPEVLLRSETVSVFKMNGRESIAIKSKFCNEWFARNVNSKSMTREEAEERAKDWLKQQARSQ